MIKYVLKSGIIFTMILVLGILLIPLIKFNEIIEKEVNNTVHSFSFEVLNAENNVIDKPLNELYNFININESNHLLYIKETWLVNGTDEIFNLQNINIMYNDNTNIRYTLRIGFNYKVINYFSIEYNPTNQDYILNINNTMIYSGARIEISFIEIGGN